jgi:hypothetical protein
MKIFRNLLLLDTYSNTKKIVLFFILYNFIVVALSLSSISLLSFLHFQLSHDMSVIENWLYRNAWEIIILIKLFSAYLILKFIEIRSASFTPIKEYLMATVRLPSYFVFVIMLFLGATIGSITDLTVFEDRDKYILMNLLSYLGHILYFGIDLFLIYYFIYRYEVKSLKSTVLLGLSLTGCFILSSFISIPYTKNHFIFMGMTFFTCYAICTFVYRSWVNFLTFLVFFAAPIAAFFGQDIIWGRQFSLSSISLSNSLVSIIGVWVVSICYLVYLKKYRQFD